MLQKFLIIGIGGSGVRAYRIIKSLIVNGTIKVLDTSRDYKVNDNVFDCGSVLYDIEEAVKFKPQGVFIAVPTSKHVEYAELFLGVADLIIIDKPLDADLLTCERFVRNCNTVDTKVYVNFQRRYLYCWQSLKRAFSEEDDGKFEYGNITIGSNYRNWRKEKPSDRLYVARKNLGGGVLLTECHEIDLIQWLFGEINSTTCNTQYAVDSSVENYAQLLLSVGTSYGERSISLTVDDLSPVEQRQSSFRFENATYTLDELTGVVQRIDKNGGVKTICDVTPDMMEAHTFLIKSAISGASDTPSKEDGLRTNAVIHAAKISAKENRKVAVKKTVCPLEGAPYLEYAVKELQASFGDKITAIYGLGSLGYGGYVESWSDFDIDVLINCDISESESVYKEGKRIEKKIVDAGFNRIDIRVYNPIHLNQRRTILSYGQCSRACMLCDSAVLLAGKDIKNIIVHPTIDECNKEAIGLIKKMTSFSEEWWGALPWDDIAAHFSLVARFFYTSDFGKVAGKKTALEYFLNNYSSILDNNDLKWILWALALRSKHESLLLQDRLHFDAVKTLKGLFFKALEHLKNRTEGV